MALTNNGFVKLHRSLIEWEWWDDYPVFRLFIYLVMKANHAPKKWRGTVIDRGQLITSIQSLSDATGLSVKQIRTALTKLENTGELAIKRTNKYSVITLVKYGLYQDRITDEGKQTGKQEANKGQAKGKQRATNKNEKNNKNEKKDRGANPRFVKPTKQQVVDKFRERLADHRLTDNPETLADRFIAYYDSNGWKVGRNKMVSWESTVTTWITRIKENAPEPAKVVKSNPVRYDT